MTEKKINRHSKMSVEKYVIITPVRDEEAYIEETIKSVITQTIEPVEWVIVNDGSTDNTGKIIDSYARQYPWIRAIQRENRGYREAGGGVIEAFYKGYDAITCPEWDFIVKLDGDLSFDYDYFETCFEYFRKEHKLGIGGGAIYHVINNLTILEESPLFHVRGATKIYRKECWDGLGGLIKAPGWDTIDEVKANMLGWETRTFLDLRVIHHRYTGKADGTWHNSVKNGLANYVSGYHPLFMLLKCARRVFQKPYIIGSLGLFCGFITGYLHKIDQVKDKALIDYLRTQQLRKLFFKSTIWK